MWFLIFMLMICTSCTYSINMIHSERSADDLKESQSSNAEVSPTIKVPVI